LQDYRNRYATYHLDEGLRNLRRRAPVIQIWDDHELTNNAYGEGDIFNTGAENHQETCSANRDSTDEEKAAAQCDRDEGNVKIRFNNAAQAYMEWMPLRRGPGNMGVIDITSITQVIEWGELASIVAIDTRVTSRSMEPTLASVFNDFAGFAFGNTNMSAYYDPNSEIRQTFDTIASGTKDRMNDPSFTMIGEDNFQLVSVFISYTCSS
jgi:Phosphodiesterase/alkaline phosphatase D